MHKYTTWYYLFKLSRDVIIVIHSMKQPMSNVIQDLGKVRANCFICNINTSLNFVVGNGLYFSKRYQVDFSIQILLKTYRKRAVMCRGY